MSHLDDSVDQDVEHLAEDLWTLGEEGRNSVEELRESTHARDKDRALERLVRLGLADIDGDKITLTRTGRSLAERQVRRHRLAEVLLSTVLDVQDDGTVEQTACVMEHVLGLSVTDSVCAFLGHPKFCPHGKPIPAGRCCQTFSEVVEPLVHPLTSLPVGEAGRIVHIVPSDPHRLVRLSTLGVVPGAEIRLRQKQPATVIGLGETTVALDPAIAREIYVKRIV
jgi:DtxR family Mn-dependent transcriptional regulator